MNLHTAKKKAKENVLLKYNIQMQESRRIAGQTYAAFGLPANFRPVYNPAAPVQPEKIPVPKIKIGKNYTDSNQTTHTIAYADRGETARPFASGMEAGAVKVRALTARAEQISPLDPFSRYALCRAATLTAMQNQLLIIRTALLYPLAAADFDPGYSLSDLFARAAAASTVATVRISIENDTSGIISGLITETVRAAGLTPATNGTLFVTGKFEPSVSQTKDHRNADIKYTLTLRLADRSGRTLVRFHDKHSERYAVAEAEAKTTQALTTAIRQDFAQNITAALNRAAGVAD